MRLGRWRALAACQCSHTGSQPECSVLSWTLTSESQVWADFNGRARLGCAGLLDSRMDDIDFPTLPTLPTFP
jgi:hypothetical protein